MSNYLGIGSSTRIRRVSVTLRQGLKPHGCFCLSSVRDRLSNAAWPRLVAHRSGGGKARDERIHSSISFLGGAMPVPASMPGAKGSMAHTLRSASWEAGTPASFEASSEEHTHQIGGFSCAIFCRTTLPKAVEWLPVPSLRNRADTLGNAVTFVRSTLRATTPTLFRFQGIRGIFSQRSKKVERHEKQGLKPETPNLCHLSGEACGGLKPFSVKRRGRDKDPRRK
jgi:hypothetical protein